MNKRYGEFKCPYPNCDYMCHDKKQLDGHIGGAHKKNITQDGIPRCKFCNDKLIKGKNWPKWAIKQRNLICIKCKRQQNRKSYRNRVKKRNSNRVTKLKSLKEKLNAANP